MSWASGSFTRIFGATGWVDDKNAATNILSSRHDTHDQDIADGINACITRDNQAKPTADFLPAITATYNIGSAGVKWLAGFFSGNVSAGSFTNGMMKRKTAATLRHSTTTLTADPDLTVTLAAGAYAIQGFLAVGNVLTADSSGFKYDFSYTGTVTSSNIGNTAYINGAVAGRFSSVYNSAQTYSTLDVFSGTFNDFISLIGVIVVSTGGTFTLRWSQATSTTTDVAIDVGSWIVLNPIT